MVVGSCSAANFVDNMLYPGLEDLVQVSSPENNYDLNYEMIYDLQSDLHIVF